MPPVSTPEESTEKPSILKERRFKLSRACDRCRRRRIKCDEGHPCQSCLTANSACTFEEPGKRTHPHKSKRASTLEDRMHHLETLIQSIPLNLFTGNPAGFPMPSILSGDPNSPHASLASTSHVYPSGVPPPSLSNLRLTNPSTYFPTAEALQQRAVQNGVESTIYPDSYIGQLTDEAARSSLAPSYLYLDDEGYMRWQGETSGLPLLDLLVDRRSPPFLETDREAPNTRRSAGPSNRRLSSESWFPDRQPRRVNVNPETLWGIITSYFAPELMDSLVRCFLSTSYYLMPFLHVPTFLEDYGNPMKWGEPGFASFIVAICCLSSRHIDDPRVRADPSDGFSAGVQWFDLFNKLRTLPTADRPTLYTVQSVFVAAVYAIGLGKLSKAFALLSEAITLSIDAGLHRSAEAYDCFDSIEEEVRKRTFWCVYMWDKQAAAAFGRPPMIRLRDCDVPEPAIVDDEFITKDAVGPQPAGVESRLGAFVETVRMFVVLESVLDVPPTYNKTPSSFLARASHVLSGYKRHKALREEEVLLDGIIRGLPGHWAHTAETMSSDNVIRVTQSERLHCLGLFIRMLIQRHRYSDLLTERTYGGSENEQSEAERDAMMACHACALQLVHAHLQVATKGLMTYYGVHVIHQLTQAGRTLVAVLLGCKSEDIQPLLAPSLEALRSCVGLLRRFSGRYVCGLRSGDLIEEFCRVTGIPLDAPLRNEIPQVRPPWIRPARKKTPSGTRSAAGSSESGNSPESTSTSAMDALFDMSMSPQSSATLVNGADQITHPQQLSAYALDSAGPIYNMDTSDAPNLEHRSDLPDAASHLSSSTLLSMLSDGQLDMNSIFFSDSLAPRNPHQHDEHAGPEPFAGLFTKVASERGTGLTA